MLNTLSLPLLLIIPGLLQNSRALPGGCAAGRDSPLPHVSVPWDPDHPPGTGRIGKLGATKPTRDRQMGVTLPGSGRPGSAWSTTTGDKGPEGARWGRAPQICAGRLGDPAGIPGRCHATPHGVVLLSHLVLHMPIQTSKSQYCTDSVRGQLT